MIRSMPGGRAGLVVAIAVLLGSAAAAILWLRPAAAAATFAGSAQCASCHQQAFEAWQSSHHHQAMLAATSESVLGDFDDAQFTHFSVKHDVSVRIADVPKFLELAGAELERVAPHRLSVYGHIGDGNLHYNLLPPEGLAANRFRDESGEPLSHAVHELAARLGGSFSAEHGVGVLKAPELERYRSSPALGTMYAVKRALDPHGIKNPGKMLRSAGGRPGA